MRGVDHNGLAELLSNGAGRRFRGISRPEHVANFPHGIYSLVNNCNRLFRTGGLAFLASTFAGFFAGHELDNALPVFAAAFCPELFLKQREHWSIEVLRLRYAHSMDLEADD